MTSVDPVLPWYDDLASCLQIDIGHVLELQGWDPVQVLGAGWRFRTPQGPVEPVEYFHPAGERLQEEFCLYHPVRLTWHEPRDPRTAHDDVIDALTRVRGVIVAVNNFHLPFRPAYHDVHAAHLIIVTGWDERRELYRVIDPMPPAYSGTLPRSVLEKARRDISVDHKSDPFFAGSRPAWRWLEVVATGPQPRADMAWVDKVMSTNIAALNRPDQGPHALATYLFELPRRIERHGSRALREIYVLGWPAQAEAAFHSAFLYRMATRFERPDLADAASSVGRVAHAWTGFRIAAAHAAAEDEPTSASATARVEDLGKRLLMTWEQCMHRLRGSFGRKP
ncbi:BtrH N-terminal domain-containing protein [Nocardiopsis alkaliphila]|uniref:BtrH N-terminal domain-containing protein n=1 Tax=Nocardiopsis alkaliphila TaxID=225762 RepID=UPI000348008F|nr:BtrH N-terminal domain-containing protein [Nocardiopsis alkaliphila]